MHPDGCMKLTLNRGGGKKRIANDSAYEHENEKFLLTSECDRYLERLYSVATDASPGDRFCGEKKFVLGQDPGLAKPNGLELTGMKL